MTAEQLVIAAAIAILILMLFLIFLLLIRFAEKMSDSDSRSGSSGNQSGNYDESESEDDSAERMLAQAATGISNPQKAKEQMIRQILKSDEEFLKSQMMRQAGLGHDALKDMSHQEELVRRLARELNLEELIALSIACTTKDVQVTAQSGEKDVPVNYPSDDLKIERLRDLEQISQVSAEDLADPTFVYRLATDDLAITQYYETVYEQAVLYMLQDVSGSMRSSGSTTIPPYITARGVGCRLLELAIKGKATYIHRFFDGDVHPKRMASTPEEAQRVYDAVARSGYSGAGTDILNAIKIAVRDIREETGLVNAEILLISDGEDSAVNSAQELRGILGDIKLHVILLGGDNSTLKEVATSYKKY